MADITFPCRIEDLPTPCLLVDEDAVRQNCEKMLSKASSADVTLRPHVKTHKTMELALMQVTKDQPTTNLPTTVARAE